MKKWLGGVAIVAFVVTGCEIQTDEPVETNQTTQLETTQTDESQNAETSEPSAQSELKSDIEENFGTTSWGMTITDVRIENSNVFVTAQIAKGDTETAKRIQTGVINLVRSGDYGDISFVIVEDGTGTVVTQESV
ncbi:MULTISPECIES: hypothetical protein [Gordonia]|uniref:Lipoprotein n=1 Tax=Gordonia amicalis TaxID=89053 RepID=A0ABU4DCG8_9ACTN|nr:MULTISPECIES: hypothetical protein [Gordonia]MCZ4652781.1 hypothetical protein [Gordonia amicalis]MDV6306811.1 hypothetical protein [Gordonia amicalis]